MSECGVDDGLVVVPCCILITSSSHPTSPAHHRYIHLTHSLLVSQEKSARAGGIAQLDL